MPLDPVQRDDTRAGGQCVEIDPALTKVLRSAAPMTEYAWKFRYPGDVFEPPREEVDRALALAREVVAKIESLVR